MVCVFCHPVACNSTETSFFCLCDPYIPLAISILKGNDNNTGISLG